MAAVRAMMSPEQRRYQKLQGIGCICCGMRGRSSQADIHHLNENGHAGQARRGDRYTIPLCPWHHRGVPLSGLDRRRTEVLCGPSLALSPRLFRETFGSDDDLLAATDARIGALEAAIDGPESTRSDSST